MQHNPILDELYAIRRQIMAEHADDLTEYLHMQFERTKSSGHPIAQVKQRTIRCTGAAKSADLPAETFSLPPGDR
jgi:hypothetical protein